MSSDKKEKKNKRLLKVLIPISLYAVLIAGIIWGRIAARTQIEIIPELIPSATGSDKMILQTAADINVIPDKYNCGAKGNLREVIPGETINDVLFRDGKDTIVLEFAYKNSKISGNIVFENLDFSKYTLAMYNESLVQRKIHVTFKNCKFAAVKNATSEENITYEYDNCDFSRYYGSNATFNRCIFGHTYRDGMIPFQNIAVNDSYFCDLSSNDPASVGLHSDGTQIYGSKDTPVYNVSMNRCRFEVPAIQTSGNTASVNACIMFQLEYNDASNVSFNNCIVNGGGYSIYAYAFSGLNVSNVSFNNIAIGGAHMFGNIHPNVNTNVVFDNVFDQDSLYVSSVWKEAGKIHIIVSNDTTIQRRLKVYTNNGEEEFTIPACLGGKDIRYNYKDILFDSFPFDQDIVIKGDADYVVCFDVTSGAEKQIRFVPFVDKAVFIEKSEEVISDNYATRSMNGVDGVIDTSKSLDVMPSLSQATASKSISLVAEKKAENASVVISGSCGKDATYYLDSNGVLHICGNGIMNNYNSIKTAPWYAYASSIKEIVFDEGITQIGAQAFRKLTKVEKVSLPQSLTVIGANAFQGCKGLTNISLYSEVSSIGKYAFNQTKLAEINFFGSVDAWNSISVGANNTELLKCEVKYGNAIELPEIVRRGTCGKSVSYELFSNGTLHIFGTGAMDSYNSAKSAPWYDMVERILSVVIDEGVTTVGSQALKNAKSLVSVSLPYSLKSIGSNAFINCKSLKGISFNENLELIGRYAFNGTGITNVEFWGSERQWKKVSVSDFNEKILDNIHFMR